MIALGLSIDDIGILVEGQLRVAVENFNDFVPGAITFRVSLTSNITANPSAFYGFGLICPSGYYHAQVTYL